jgi:hypothetical protein
MADAAERIEAWLLGDGPQVTAGRHAGAVAGWLKDDGTRAFLYPEITGYFLTWLSFVAALRPEKRDEVAQRAASAVAWLTSLHEDDAPPATRIEGRCDWRSATVFSFDVAIVLRGLACVLELAGAPAEALLRRLAGRFPSWFGGADVLQAHLPLTDGTTLPDRWATRPGVHHVKAACALLLLPPDALAAETRALAERTVEHWRAAVAEEPELHPALYGVEGLFLLGHTHDAARGFAALMKRLPAASARADVLAQALRLHHLLGARERPIDTLEHFITRGGSVVFSLDPPLHHNVWAAMFAHQALTLADGTDTSAIKWSHALV